MSYEIPFFLVIFVEWVTTSILKFFNRHKFIRNMVFLVVFLTTMVSLTVSLHNNEMWSRFGGVF